MRTPKGVPAFIERLENRVDDLVSGRKRVVLAYSGGLSSTLLAMVARKRCELLCVVAGVDGSADVRAAKMAKDYLDYRVEYVTLNSAESRRMQEDVISSGLSLSSKAVASLIPLRAVQGRKPKDMVLAGFGSPRNPREIGLLLRRWEVESPLASPSGGRPVPRSMLRAATVSLGLPLEWADVTHRDPATGAGIDDFLERTSRTKR
jgi:hypothetical protein